MIFTNLFTLARVGLVTVMASDDWVNGEKVVCTIVDNALFKVRTKCLMAIAIDSAFLEKEEQIQCYAVRFWNVSSKWNVSVCG